MIAKPFSVYLVYVANPHAQICCLVLNTERFRGSVMSLVVHTYSLAHNKADMFIFCSTLAPAAYEETVLVCKSCYDYLMNKVDDMKTDIW